MKHLTNEQITILNQIKEQGLYDRDGRYGKSHDHNGKGHRRDALFLVLHTGLGMYGVSSFKARHITKQYCQYGHQDKRYARYQDIPLTTGEIINAIKHGKRHGLLEKDSRSRIGLWHLTSKGKSFGGGEK